MMERLVRAQQKVGARDAAEADDNVLVLQAAM
jgi:hypothetical protein